MKNYFLKLNLVKRKIRLLFFILFIFPFVCFSAIGIKIPVDVTCNENAICEPEQNENDYTCPTDCKPNIFDPEYLQNHVVNEPIKIFNLEVFVGITETSISWQTNQPTTGSLILSDEKGNVKKAYINEEYVDKHLVIIENFIFGDNYFSKFLLRIFMEIIIMMKLSYLL